MVKIYNKTIRPLFINGQTIAPKTYSDPMPITGFEMKNLERLKNSGKISVQEVIESQPLVVEETSENETNKTTRRRRNNDNK